MNRLRKTCIIFWLISLWTFFSLSAQAAKEKDDVLFQHLEWESRGTVKEYKLVVEEKQGDSYVEILSKITKNNFYDISLRPGEYRYTLCFYNVLGQLAFQTEYKNFKILKATQPKVKKKLVQSYYTASQDSSDQLVIDVKEIDSSSEFYLLTPDKKEIKAVSVNVEGSKVILKFPEGSITNGNYRVKIKNKGGLTSTTGVIRVREKKKIYFDGSLGYIPGFVVGNDFIPDYFDTRLVWKGFFQNLNLTFNVEEAGRFGAGLFVRECFLGNEYSEGVLLGNLLSFNLNAVYILQLPDLFNRKFYADFYAGPGLNILYDLHYLYDDNSTSNSRNSILPCLDVGADVKLFVTEKFFVQTGLEWFNTIDFKKSDYGVGTINIFVGAGIGL